MRDFEKVVNLSSQYLSVEELELYLAVLRSVLEAKIVDEPKVGAIALYEQKRGMKAECVFILKFEEGEQMVVCDGGKTALSTSMADSLDKAVRDLLNWPKCESYECDPDPLEFGQLGSGICYGKNDNFALVLNTTLGRFVMGSYIGFAVNSLEEFKKVNAAMLIAMAQVFWQLRPGDILLSRSISSMELEYLQSGETLQSEGTRRFIPAVKKFFRRQAGYEAELKAWDDWRHKEIEESGRLRMYFS